MADHQLYSKKDISKILAKASEIQTRKDLYGDKEGLTEEELISVAGEVGISKESLLEALESYSQPSVNDKYEWVKATSRIQSIVNVEGEITDKQWEEVVQEIRRVTGGIGKISRVGNSFEWEQRRRDIGYKHISFTPEKGKTKIQLVNSWGPLRFMATFVSFMTAFVLTAIALDGSGLTEFPSFALSLMGGTLGLPLGRIFLRIFYKKQKDQVEELISSLSKKLKSPKDPRITIEEEEVYLPGSESTSSSKIHS